MYNSQENSVTKTKTSLAFSSITEVNLSAGCTIPLDVFSFIYKKDECHKGGNHTASGKKMDIILTELAPNRVQLHQFDFVNMQLLGVTCLCNVTSSRDIVRILRNL